MDNVDGRHPLELSSHQPKKTKLKYSYLAAQGEYFFYHYVKAEGLRVLKSKFNKAAMFFFVGFVLRRYLANYTTGSRKKASAGKLKTWTE